MLICTEVAASDQNTCRMLCCWSSIAPGSSAIHVAAVPMLGCLQASPQHAAPAWVQTARGCSQGGLLC